MHRKHLGVLLLALLLGGVAAQLPDPPATDANAQTPFPDTGDAQLVGKGYDLAGVSEAHHLDFFFRVVFRRFFGNECGACVYQFPYRRFMFFFIIRLAAEHVLGNAEPL
jgi:hypothetical protein